MFCFVYVQVRLISWFDLYFYALTSLSFLVFLGPLVVQPLAAVKIKGGRLWRKGLRLI